MRTCGPYRGLVQPESELVHARLDGAVCVLTVVNSEGGNLSLSSGGRMSLV